MSLSPAPCKADDVIGAMQRIYKDMVKPAFIFDGRNILNHSALREVSFPPPPPHTHSHYILTLRALGNS